MYNDTFGTEYEFDRIMDRRLWEELYLKTIEIKNLKVKCEKCSDPTTEVVWDDVCFNPLSDEKNPDAGGCSLFSIFQYWQNDFEKIEQNYTYTDREGTVHETDYRDHILYCTRTPSALTNKYFNLEPCAGDFGSPIFPYLAMGGYNGTAEDYWNGNALIVSFINANIEDKKSDAFFKVEAWEGEFIEIMRNTEFENFEFAYFAERSIEDEIDATTESDLIIFVISYTVIFLYIMTALGSYSSLKRVPVDMKISLAVGGILMILASALAASGIFGYADVPSNLIVMEVVPFLLLAIGADNVFILVMDIQREPRTKEDTNADVISRVLGRGGPSMLLCALTESTVLFIGAVSEMPAVRVFALNAGFAILFNFILQITAFLALILIDMNRMESNRWDVIYCLKSSEKPPEKIRVSPVQKFFSDHYTPILMNDLVGFGVICAFIALLGSSIYFISTATIGLDQDLSVPSTSYVSKYFDYMAAYLMVGVPVYFVIEGKYDYQKEEARHLVCSYAGCNVFSLAEQVSRAAQQSEESMIVTPATVWVDDYEDWLRSVPIVLY